MILVPDYYKEFRCIAGRCRHTCCAGWEIDIDSESLARYEKDGIPNIVCPDADASSDALPGALADTAERPHFALDKDLRCAFLREDNLCQMILDHGEDYLCRICKDHPRFRNFWTGITETGLGLSCEEAARIILLREEPMQLVAEEPALQPDDGSGLSGQPENGTADTQQINTNNSLTVISDAIKNLPEDELALWKIRDDMLKDAASLPDRLQARLAEYLIFRQIPDALYDGLLDERIRFVWESVNEITDLWDASEDQSEEALIEIARSWSEKLEYNPEALKIRLLGLSEP